MMELTKEELKKKFDEVTDGRKILTKEAIGLMIENQCLALREYFEKE